LTATATGSLLWYTVATGGTGNATAPTPSTTTVGSTTYYVSQTQAGCESARASIIVTVNALPTANASNTGPYCGINGNITINATGGNSYNWSGPNGFTANTASPAPFSAATYGAGAYNVTVTDANNCTATASTTVVTNNTPAPTVTSPATYCQNATAAPLTATGAGSLLWYTTATGGTGNATAPTPSTTSSGSTTYYVSQTQNGCESTREPIVVTVNPVPAATASNTGPYCGTSGTITINATGGTSYTWSGPNAYNAAGASPAPFSAAIYGGGAYSVTVSDVNNCTATATTTVVINSTSPPTVTSPVTYCQNAIAMPLNATGPGNLLWYTTATGGTGSTTAPTPSTSTSGSTTYYVSQTQNGCESTRDSIVVTVNPIPVAIASNTGPYCTSGTITITATGGTSYNWSGPNGYSTTVGSPSPFSAATYGGGTYSVTVTTTNNCTATASTIVVVSNSISTPFSQTICHGQIFTFNGQNLMAAGVYRDTLSAGSGCDSIVVLTLTVLPTSSTTLTQTICGGASFVFNGQMLNTSGTYYDTLTNIGGCDSIVVLTLTVAPEPVAAFSIQPSGDSIALGTSVFITNNSTNATSVQWFLNNQAITLSSAGNLPVSDTGTYCINLIAGSAGCNDTGAAQCIYVYTKPSPPHVFFVPNAFTPNGDGNNDFVEIYGSIQQINYLSINIYDRWGEKVFESNNSEFKWDGSYKGKPLPMGVYTYEMDIEFIGENSIRNKGSITLIR
jgi:gliding motility-associated-like protein